MEPERIIKLLQIEKECVERASGKAKDQHHVCLRDCWNCDLVQDTDELIDMYDACISIISNDTADRPREKG